MSQSFVFGFGGDDIEDDGIEDADVSSNTQIRSNLAVSASHPLVKAASHSLGDLVGDEPVVTLQRNRGPVNGALKNVFL